MIEPWGWNRGGRSNRIVIQDPVKGEVEKRVKNVKGFKPVLVNGEPMKVKEEVDFRGSLYYVIVLEREEKTPTEE